MNRGKKIVLTAGCGAALVTVSILGTLAYLTDTDYNVNTFTVGRVGITLDEAKVNPDGTPVAGADRVKENNYHLLPGQTYIKDPTITVNAGSEEAYVRILVTINNAGDLKAIFGDDFLPENYIDGWDKTIWPCSSITEHADDTITYEFRYYTTADASDLTEGLVLDALFETITVPGELTGEDLAAISDLEITVTGHAIQAAGFEDAQMAWAAFEEQMGS